MRIKLKQDYENVHVEQGSSYLVYAIYAKPDPSYMIMVDSFPSGPYSVDGKYCEIVDDRASRYWSTGPSFPRKTYRITSFPEWAKDDGFYEELIDGGKASAIWNRYRLQMDMEFVDPKITIQADSLGDGWLQCISCSDAWQDVSTNEMSACSSCKVLQRKPTT